MTSGSDCHGEFQKTYAGGILDIGVNKTQLAQLHLGDISIEGEFTEE